MYPASNWNQLKNRCSNSACSSGGCTIYLRSDFDMGSYTGEIDFSNKYITIWGQGGTLLDAAGGGRFFAGSGAGSWLVLHGVVLQNGAADSMVSLGITFHAHYLLASSERFYLRF
jgi:hypothetical protein